MEMTWGWPGHQGMNGGKSDMPEEKGSFVVSILGSYF